MKNTLILLMGALVGAAIALLFAPQTGEELRAKMLSAVEDEWKQLQEKYPDETGQIQAGLEQIQSGSKQVPEEPAAEGQANSAESEADQPV
jgi:gas vesicle protein